YSNATCAPGAGNANVLSTENVNVSSNTPANSSATSALAAGSYSYQAAYNGNANYNTATGACEPFTVNQAGSSTSSLVKDGTTTVDNTTHAALGDQVHDTSSVSSLNNSFSLAGTVTYSLYPTNDCSGTASTSEAKTVAADGTVPASSLSAS